MADQLTLSQPGEADHAKHIATGTPGFSDLPTTLDQPEYETYDFIQYETSEGVPFLETYESVTVEQVMQIIKNEFEIELTSNILKSIEDSVIDSVLKKLSNGPAIVDWTFEADFGKVTTFWKCWLHTVHPINLSYISNKRSI